jgi:DNA-directed RNA polymerase subunit RPC12/RpoP
LNAYLPDIEGPPMTEPEPEVEIVCTNCGHRMTRTAARLRRETKVVCPACGHDIVDGDSPAPDRR